MNWIKRNRWMLAFFLALALYAYVNRRYILPEPEPEPPTRSSLFGPKF